MATKVLERERGARSKLDGNLMVSQQFAQCLGAFKECSDEIQQVILEMAGIVNDPEASDDERHGAIVTIAEALFPCRTSGAPGIDLEELESSASGEDKLMQDVLDQEEATFANRLQDLMDKKGLSQGELASMIGVGQPAISMMLARKCRPQRRTVEKIATALDVPPEEIWPSGKTS